MNRKRGGGMKPFLVWAGGKYRIIERVLDALPTGNRLVEPFVGSGAVFLNAGFDTATVADSNQDLIGLYQIIQAEGEAFAHYAAALFVPENNTETVFYQYREEFNASKDLARKAALFVYLNRHCFNGLCRYNGKGKFNVSFGRHAKPQFPMTEMLGFHQKSQSVTFNVADFRGTLDSVPEGSVVYCDPPYAPLTATANFSSYTAAGFGLKDQQDLAIAARMLRERNIPVVISNHDTEFTRSIYSDARIVSFDVQRFISSDAKNRGKAAELLAIYD